MDEHNVSGGSCARRSRWAPFFFFLKRRLLKNTKERNVQEQGAPLQETVVP